MAPDPKSGGRIVDRSALRAARLSGDACVSCGRRPSNVHHIIERGSPHFGDDVAPNLLLLCGSGTARCHGATHGSPYVDENGKRWTVEEVNARIGAVVLADPARVAYVIEKLGTPEAAAEYLLRRYGVRADSV